MSTDERLTALQYWLTETLKMPIDSITSASTDASFRRYFRVVSEGKSYIVMDAPPEKETLTEFISINQALTKQQVHAPSIHAQNLEHGFLLLEDLGDRTYLNELKEKPEKLYQAAIGALILIQQGTNAQADYTLPHYDNVMLQTELDLFIDWYLKQHLNIELSEQEKNSWRKTSDFLINACQQQPQVWVHRDYHSRNLMITDYNSPGVIDFQDMVLGPITYDLASLFKDCYIEWPREQQIEWLNDYFKKLNEVLPDLNITIEQFIRWYDLTGLQRHLKVLGIFCRLNYRDNKPHYLTDLQLVEKYVCEVLDIYPELTEFKTLFQKYLT